MTIRVVIADDHPVARLGLRMMLTSSPGFEVIAECEDGVLALEKCLDLQPDVALLDLRLPGLSAFEISQKLRQQGASGRVVVITAQPTVEEREAARSCGVVGLLGKAVLQAELLRVLRAANDGKNFLDSDDLVDSPNPLSAREVEVLRLVATGATNKIVAQRLDLSAGTVRVHLGNVFSKLGVTTRTEAVTLAIRQGWITL